MVHWHNTKLVLLGSVLFIAGMVASLLYLQFPMTGIAVSAAVGFTFFSLQTRKGFDLELAQALRVVAFCLVILYLEGATYKYSYIAYYRELGGTWEGIRGTFVRYEVADSLNLFPHLYKAIVWSAIYAVGDYAATRYFLFPRQVTKPVGIVR